MSPISADSFNLLPFLRADGAIRYLAAPRATILLKLGPEGEYAKLCTLAFNKSNGGMFAQFTHYKAGPGIAASVKTFVRPGQISELRLGEWGKVATDLLKYSHPPDGRAHLSQDGKSVTTFWSDSLPLTGGEGALFDAHAHHLEPFETLSSVPTRSSRLYLPFETGERPAAAVIAVQWRRKDLLQKWAIANNRVIDFLDYVPRLHDKTLVRTLLLGQPASFPLQDHVLAINVTPVPLPATITSPSLILMGGWSADTRLPAEGREMTFLAFMYPIVDAVGASARLGSIDYRSASP